MAWEPLDFKKHYGMEFTWYGDDVIWYFDSRWSEISKRRAMEIETAKANLKLNVYVRMNYTQKFMKELEMHRIAVAKAVGIPYGILQD